MLEQAYIDMVSWDMGRLYMLENDVRGGCTIYVINFSDMTESPRKKWRTRACTCS